MINCSLAWSLLSYVTGFISVSFLFVRSFIYSLHGEHNLHIFYTQVSFSIILPLAHQFSAFMMKTAFGKVSLF